MAPCVTAVQVHVLGLNARRLYRLPSRRSGLPGLIDDYFTAVTAQEIDLVRALFTPDAVFESGDTRLEGLDAISGYYTSKTFTFDDFRPVPGVPNFDGTRVHVDIDVDLGARRTRCTTCSRRTARASPRSGSADSTRPSAERNAEAELRQAG